MNKGSVAQRYEKRKDAIKEKHEQNIKIYHVRNQSEGGEEV